MPSKKLAGIARKLILAEKRINKIETVRAPFQVYPAFSIPAPKIPVPVQAQPPKIIPLAPLDLGKLSEFVSDNSVRAIECPGANQNIKVKKENIIETNVRLDETEIIDIIKKFSKASGMPQTPIMRAIYSNMTINAFVSATLGSKFFILKH